MTGLRELNFFAADLPVNLTCHTSADQARYGRPSAAGHHRQQ
jgi:hypothetical protein